MQEVFVIACSEYLNAPSGGKNDIFSDIYYLNKNNISTNLLLIDNQNHIFEITKKNKFDISRLKKGNVLISGFITAERLFSAIPRLKFKKKILINIKDLHFLRELRKELSTNRKTEHNIIFQRELSIFNMCDLVLSYSEKEIGLINKLDPKIKTHLNYFYNPNFEGQDYFNPCKRLVFAGNFDHSPNLDGILFLINSCKDPILKYSYKLDIYGPNSIENLSKFNIISNDWINIHGQVENPLEIYEGGGIFISPLKYGAGIKIKIIEAALCHMPIVATPESIEGMPLLNAHSFFQFKNSQDLELIFSTLNNLNNKKIRYITDNAYKAINYGPLKNNWARELL